MTVSEKKSQIIQRCNDVAERVHNESGKSIMYYALYLQGLYEGEIENLLIEIETLKSNKSYYNKGLKYK